MQRLLGAWMGLMVCGVMLAGLVAGCFGGDNDDADTGSGADAAAREGYPAAPYGTAQNAVIENHSTFLLPDGSPWSLSDVYQDGRNRMLLISTSASWCTACIKEQPKIQALYEEYGARGLTVLVAVFEDAQFKPATAALAADWKARYGLTATVVADPSFIFKAYYDATLTPMNMLVDVNTMQIIWLTTGWDQSTIEALLDSRL